MLRRHVEIPYKANGKSRFLELNTEKELQKGGKTLPTQGFRNAFPQSRETL